MGLGGGYLPFSFDHFKPATENVCTFIVLPHMFCAFCIYGVVVVVIQFNGLYVLLEAETNA